MLQHLRCLGGAHRPDRRRAWFDGVALRAPCRGCGRLMLREFQGWRLFRAADHDVERRPHPRFDLQRDPRPPRRTGVTLR